jgi:aspartyl-tRNA(Asn)/glutamyl-tRNA(Gln) amidotransferase subunit A
MSPTYGAVSRSGVIAMTSSLDQVGPITKTVADAAILFKAMAGKDPLDATSADHDFGTDLMNPNLEKIKQLTVGLPEEYFIDGTDTAVT